MDIKKTTNLLTLNDLTREELQVLDFLGPISLDYPGIDKWYLKKVVPGFRLGTRKFIQITDNDKLIALGIIKNEADEKKICTVRVAPEYVGRKLGYRVVDEALKWLDDDHPHLTVNAEKLPIFQKLFDYYDFDLTSKASGLYLPAKVELGLNGIEL